MSGNFPFGFQPPDPDDKGGNPLGGFDLSNLGEALESLGRMLQAGGDGPVNWDMAKQIARQNQAQKDDPGVTAPQRSDTEESVRLAQTWLDGSSTFAASNAAAIAWSRGDWVDQTLPAWQRMITPVAEHVTASMSGMLSGEGMPEGIPGLEGDQLQQMLGPLAGLAKQMGSAMFANQVGQGLGELSGEVLCSSDIGIPLTPDGRPSLLPANIALFADGLGIDRKEVLLYIALRESAHQRLFTHVPWLRSRLEAAVDAYARGIHVDMSQLEEAMGKMDPNNPASIQDAMSEGMFEPKDTPEQQAALARLETLLALVEGWVDNIITEAAGDRMPLLGNLVEAMRRRRAAGGPAEKTFANLVGLEMRPKRLREAAQFWSQVAPGDADARDASWEHPDLLPTAEDLDDLDAFFARSAAIGELQIPDDLADRLGAPEEGSSAERSEAAGGGPGASPEPESPESPAGDQDDPDEPKA